MKNQDASFNPSKDIPRLHELAKKNIFLGTSSWKYEGWLHQVYNQDYERTVKGQKVLNQTKFKENCLDEYATVFPTVCNDSMYYRLPEINSMEKIEKKLPKNFLMTFKCPEMITLREERTFVGGKPGKGEKNRSYLDARVFAEHVLKPIHDVFEDKLGTIIFEFSPFFFDQAWGQNKDYDHEQFVNDLGTFVNGIPKGYSYAVEVRDPILIIPGYDDYLNALKSANVSHVINGQTWMPLIEDQVKRKGIFTSDHIVIRALTRPGMKHEAAVKRYEPYTETKEPMPETRKSIAHLMTLAESNNQRLQAYVNNRLSGNAPNDIHAILDLYDEMNGIEREEMVPIKSDPSDLFS